MLIEFAGGAGTAIPGYYAGLIVINGEVVDVSDGRFRLDGPHALGIA